jgi:hypothetical protein
VSYDQKRPLAAETQPSIASLTEPGTNRLNRAEGDNGGRDFRQTKIEETERETAVQARNAPKCTTKPA